MRRWTQADEDALPRPTGEEREGDLERARVFEVASFAREQGRAGGLTLAADMCRLYAEHEDITTDPDADAGDALRQVAADIEALAAAAPPAAPPEPAAALQGAGPGWRERAAEWLRDSEAYSVARTALDMPDGQDDAPMDVLRALARTLDDADDEPAAPSPKSTEPAGGYLDGYHACQSKVREVWQRWRRGEASDPEEVHDMLATIADEPPEAAPMGGTPEPERVAELDDDELRDDEDDAPTLPRHTDRLEQLLRANPIPVEPESVERVRQRLVDAGVLPARKAGET